MSSALGVPEGYRMTEVGVIPGDWEVVSIGEISTVSAGGTPSRVINEFWNGDIPWVTTTELNFDKVIETPQYISKAGLENSATKLINSGAILIALYGQGKTRGKVALLEIQATTNQACAAIVVKACNSNIFIYHYLKSQYQAIRGMSNSGSQENLSSGIIKSILIPLPSVKAEQQAIAEALSDSDALVQSLEQLLAKKRQIKQGAMQELLTGQKRLPGFSGDWKTWRFGEVASPGRDRIDPKFEQPSNFCIELEHIGQGTGSLLGHTETTDESSLKSVFRDGDVLFGKLRAYLKKYWLATCSGVCSTEIWVLKSNESRVLPSFLFQMVSTESFIEAASMAYGTHMPRSDWSAVKNFEVQLPSIEEQTAIATILSTLDSDIDALQSQLVKARQIKQGMAQELLTGRIRLVSPSIPQGVPA